MKTVGFVLDIDMVMETSQRNNFLCNNAIATTIEWIAIIDIQLEEHKMEAVFINSW